MGAWYHGISLQRNICILAIRFKNPSGRVKRGYEYEWPLAYNELGELVNLSQLPPKGTASEIVYLTGFGNNGWYSVVNGLKGISMKVEWDARTLPYLWYWQEFGATTSYPWYGRLYNIGLEPFVGYPTYVIEEAISNGSAGSIGPYERKKFAMQVSVFVQVKKQSIPNGIDCFLLEQDGKGNYS